MLRFILPILRDLSCCLAICKCPTFHAFVWRAHLFTAENSQASTPAGLWILSALLFFVIFEKIIAAVNEEAPIITEQQTDDETSSQDMSPEKEIDNNNCIMMTTEKNGFAKDFLRNTTEVNTIKKVPSNVCCSKYSQIVPEISWERPRCVQNHIKMSIKFFSI